MLKPLGLAICLIGTPAVLASGCGSSSKTTAHTTASAAGATGTTATASAPTTKTAPATKTTPATKSPPATKTTPTTPASTSPRVTVFPATLPAATAKQAKHFNEAKEVHQKAAEGRISKQEAKAKREHIEREIEKETFHPVGTEAIRRRVPIRRQFPTEVQTTFVTGCTSTKKSIASCECILAKFEEGKGSRALRIGEAIYTEARMRLHESLPRRIRRVVEECKNAHA